MLFSVISKLCKYTIFELLGDSFKS